MKNITLIIIFLFSAKIYSTPVNSLDSELEKAINSKNYYTSLKNKKTAVLRKALESNTTPFKEYLLNEKLYGEYRKYRIDSALYFAERNLNISKVLKNKDLEIAAKLMCADVRSTNGSFLESLFLLKSVKTGDLSSFRLIKYFQCWIQFYEQYSTNNPGRYYEEQVEIYRDSLLGVLKPGTPMYEINLAQRYLYKKNHERAEEVLTEVFKKTKPNDADYALCSYFLGNISMHNKREHQGIHYYSLAALSDLKNAVKDQGAIQNLAIYHYYKGNIDLAYKYGKSSLEDAVFSNVKFRALMMSEFCAIINKAYQEKEEINKQHLKFSIFCITLLVIFLTIAIFLVNRQRKKLIKAKAALSFSGSELKKLNKEFQIANEKLLLFNDQLYEANAVKEVYIAQFFNMCSSYIDKLEDYRKKLFKKAVNKQYDEILKILKSTDSIEGELNDLYKSFDRIFLNLYPNFVTDFNSLLIEEEKIVLKGGELLNTELRIFALEKLGISDGERIAAFLRISLSTVYNYRTKFRSKTKFSKEEFGRELKNIGVQEFNASLKNENLKCL